jgi:hypothetical protein
MVFFCHFNDYIGDLTAEQKDYVEKVKWSTDLKWVEKVKNRITDEKKYISTNGTLSGVLENLCQFLILFYKIDNEISNFLLYQFLFFFKLYR